MRASSHILMRAPLAPSERIAQKRASADSRQSTIHLEMVEDRTALQALGPEWSALFARAAKPQQAFQGFDWLALWASFYLDRRTRLAIVVGRIDGRLALIWPMIVRRRFGLRILSCMGEPLSQFGDGIMAPEVTAADADAAFDYLLGLPVDVLWFRRVRDDAAIAPVLRRRMGAAFNRQQAPFLEFAGARDAAAFGKRYSGKLRSSRRRRWRRLEERGPVHVETVSQSAEAGRCAALAIAFKREWARRRGIISPSIADPRFEQFFIAAATHASSISGLRVTILRSAGEVAGVALSLVCQDCLFGHVLASHPDLDHLGLGGLLAEQTILAALEEGLTTVDMIAPATPYKLEWTSDATGLGDYALDRTAAGRLYRLLWLNAGHAFARRIVARVGPLLGRGAKR